MPVALHLIESVRARLYEAVARLDWRVFCLMVVAHMLSTHLALSLCGEEHLTGDAVTFIYFYATTASTIGYGDLSPVTSGGRLVAAIWLFLGALIFFTTFLAKVTQTAAELWRKRMDGYGDYSVEKGLTVIVGFHAKATQKIIEDLVAGGLPRCRILLMAMDMPPFDTSGIRFVRAEDLVTESDLRRAGVASAKNVLVYAETDDTTLTAALAVSALAPEAHVVAALECETKARLLKAHTGVVTVVSQSAEVVASEVLDPGISAFFSVLGSASTDVTAYALEIGAGRIDGALAYGAFRRLGMTFLGTTCGDSGTPWLNVSDDTDLTGRPLYYIASQRVSEETFKAALDAQRQENA